MFIPLLSKISSTAPSQPHIPSPLLKSRRREAAAEQREQGTTDLTMHFSEKPLAAFQDTTCNVGWINTEQGLIDMERTLPLGRKLPAASGSLMDG